MKHRCTRCGKPTLHGTMCSTCLEVAAQGIYTVVFYRDNLAVDCGVNRPFDHVQAVLENNLMHEVGGFVRVGKGEYILPDGQLACIEEVLL